MERPSIIIGIHGLANKPPVDEKTRWWKAAIAEGLDQNEGMAGAEFAFDPPLRGGPGVKLVQGRPLLHGSLGRRSWLGVRSRPSGEGGQEHLGRRRPIAQRAMRPDCIVVASPTFDHDLRLPQRVEDLAVQQLVAYVTSLTPIARIASATP